MTGFSPEHPGIDHQRATGAAGSNRNARAFRSSRTRNGFRLRNRPHGSRPSGAKGKLVTVITGLVADGNDLNDVATRLKTRAVPAAPSRTGKSNYRVIICSPPNEHSRRLGFKTKIRGA